jgi:hypothetical protein
MRGSSRPAVCVVSEKKYMAAAVNSVALLHKARINLVGMRGDRARYSASQYRYRAIRNTELWNLRAR